MNSQTQISWSGVDGLGSPAGGEYQFMSVTAFIGIGANLGDRKRNIELAILRLAENPKTRVIAVSSLIENPAVGGPVDSPPFLNAAAKMETELSPQALLRSLLSVEESLGRYRKQKWDPRPIDLDLLLYGNDIIHDEDLTVPHPLMHRRRFVLQPLAEIAADWVHPVMGETVRALLARNAES